MVLTDETELTVNMTKMLFLRELMEVTELLIELLVKMEWTETKVLGAIAYDGAALAYTIVALEDATKFTHTIQNHPRVAAHHLDGLKIAIGGVPAIAVLCGPTCHRRRSLRLGTGTLLSLTLVLLLCQAVAKPDEQVGRFTAPTTWCSSSLEFCLQSIFFASEKSMTLRLDAAHFLCRR